MSSLTNLRKRLIEQLHHLPHWTNVTEDGFLFSPLEGCMTNTVYRCTLQDTATEVEDKDVIVKFFGDTEKLFSREIEKLNIELVNTVGLAPKLLHTFNDGRIEKFLSEYHPLTAGEMRNSNTSDGIAIHLAEFHHKTNRQYRQWTNTRSVQFPTLLERLRTWYGMGKDLLNRENLLEDNPQVLKAVGKLSEKNVFCHCDLQHMNILKCDKSGDLCLIDYEYGCLAPKEFDIANHWCEWSADYLSDQPHLVKISNFPTPCEQRVFLKKYLLAMKYFDEQEEEESNIEWKQIVLNDKQEVEEEGDVERLRKETLELVPISHLMWSLWSAIQHYNNGNNNNNNISSPSKSKTFNYHAYSNQRLSLLLELSNER